MEQNAPLEVAPEMGRNLLSLFPKPPTFSGKGAAAWLAKLELYLEATAMDVDRSGVMFAGLLLSGQAEGWFRSIDRPESWEDFSAAFLGRFSPVTEEEAARDKLRDLKQEGSYQSYLEEFEELAQLIPTLSDDERKDRFYGGLQPDLRRKWVELPRLTPLPELQAALARLQLVDQPARLNAMQRQWTNRSQRKFQRGINGNGNSNNNGNSSSNNGSSSSSNSNSNDLRKRLQDSGRCFNCFEKGHYASKCPNKRADNSLSFSISSPNTMLKVSVSVNGLPCSALVDSGSSENFVRPSLSKRASSQAVKRSPLKIYFADGRSDTTSSFVTADLEVSGWNGKTEFAILEMPHDMILGLPWLKMACPTIDWKSLTLKFPEPLSQPPLHRPHSPHISSLSDEDSSLGGLYLITAEEFDDAFLEDGELFVGFLNVANSDAKDGPDSVFEEIVNEFLDVFPDDLPAELPPDRGFDFEIELLPGTKPIVQPVRRLGPLELGELKKQLTELLGKGFIQPSSSPFGAPILFVKKKDGTMRMCVDYRALNAVTVRDVYPLPLIDELFDRLRDAKYFSKLDLRSGYHQLRVAPVDVHKTAFRTPLGSFEFMVLPFGLTNAPSAFMRMMDSVFPPHSSPFVATYIDDVLIFSKTLEEHRAHLRHVLQTLRDRKLFAKRSKCMFAAKEVEFLGHIVSGEGIRADSSKLDVVRDWPTPKTVKQLQSFLGMVNYFQRFIDHFADISHPLTELLRKDNPFEWKDLQQIAFDNLKKALISPPVLRPFDPRIPIVLESDASDLAIGAVLRQGLKEDDLRPVAFLSRKLVSAELNYSVQEKEMLAIVYALNKWRHYLLGGKFKILTDHKSLIHLRTAKDPTRRLSRWFDFIADFDFEIVYRSGKENGIADSLSRIGELGAVSGPVLADDLLQKIKNGYESDTYFKPVHQTLVMKQPLDPKFRSRVERMYESDGLIYIKSPSGDRLCIPNDKLVRSAIVSEFHDSVTGGHFGTEKVYAALSEKFFWCHMGQFVKKYIQSCEICQKSKPPTVKPHGMLQPLPIPDDPWSEISMDFITHLPVTVSGMDSIMVVVDRLTKMCHLIPTTGTVTAPGAANLFVTNIFRLHGLPIKIVSDRDPKFTSEFWKTLFARLKTRLAMSSASHPQTDGQTERTNRTLEQVLRCFVNYKQSDWDTLLPVVEFSINSAVNSSTGVSPFFANYGRTPTLPVDLLVGPQNRKSKDVDDLMTRIQSTIMMVKDNLIAAQDAQAEFANNHRTEMTVELGDKVLLSTEFVVPPEESGRPSAKLRPKFTGPYPVKRIISPTAIELKLPHFMKIHPVVHISWLKKFVSNDYSVRTVEPPPEPVVTSQGLEYEVEEILDHKLVRGKKKFLIRWKGYSDNTWEPEENLENAQEALRDYLTWSS